MFHAVLLLAIIMACEGSQYYISKDATTIHDAMATCALATPGLSYTAEGITVNVSKIDIPNGVNNIWLGYVQVFRTFQYKGCLPTGGWNPIANFTTKTDIGMCYSACSGTMFFGLKSQGRGASCYCFNEVDLSHDKWTDISCTTRCSEPKYTACGGANSISLYEKVDHNNIRGSNGICVLYQPTDPAGFRWQSCSIYFATLCQSSGGVISAIYKGGWTWIGAANRCFEEGKYPAEYHKQLNLNSLPQVWTGMLRSNCYLKAHDMKDTTTTGYVYYSTIDLTLKVSSASNTMHAHALCVTGETEIPISTTVTKESISAASSTSSTYTTRPDEKSTPQGVSTTQQDEYSTTSSTYTTPSNEQETPGTETSEENVGVYVGAAVGGVLLLVVTIGGTVILFRRRAKQSAQRRSTKEPNYQNTGALAAQRNQGPADNYITACYEDPTSQLYENSTSGAVSIASSTKPREKTATVNQIGRQDHVQNNYEDVSNDTYVNTDTQKKSAMSPKETDAVKQTHIAGNYIDMSGPGQTTRDAPVTPRQDQDECKEADDSGGYYVHNIYQGLTNDTRVDTSHVYLQMNEVPNTNHKP